jgi:hypothetical protein
LRPLAERLERDRERNCRSREALERLRRELNDRPAPAPGSTPPSTPDSDLATDSDLIPLAQLFGIETGDIGLVLAPCPPPADDAIPDSARDSGAKALGISQPGLPGGRPVEEVVL